MSRPILARCDHCGNITTINFEVKKHKGRLEETYFTCVVCNHHYTCFVTDKKVRQMQTKAKNMRMVANVRNVQSELQELQEKINKRMTMLKQRIVSNES